MIPPSATPFASPTALHSVHAELGFRKKRYNFHPESERDITDMTGKLFSPSAKRNCGPIMDVLAQVLPAKGRVLEIAGGSGQHAIAAATRFPGLEWLPSDIGREELASIAAMRDEAGLKNLAPPLTVNVMAPDWWRQLGGQLDAIVSINMIHIAPWEACLGLMRGAGACLGDGGVLYCYGPYKVDGRHTAPSNAAFDDDLRARDASWGIRDVGDVETEARKCGLLLRQTIDMPANNKSLVFTRQD